MKFIINVGKNISKNLHFIESEKVFETNNVTIHASESVKQIKISDRKTVFIAGVIEGIRVALDKIDKISVTSDRFKKFVNNTKFSEVIDALEGRFIIAIVNSNGNVELSADHYGRRDFYYNRQGSNYIFASDMSLLDKPVGKDIYDQAALVHSLTIYGYRPPKKHTIYKNIKRLEVLETVKIKGSNVEIKKRAFKPRKTQDFNEKDLGKFADYFLDSLKLRGSKSGNIVYCSSGWDSTSIVAGLVHVFGSKKVRAVTNRVRYSDRSGVMNEFEVKRAKALTDYFNVKLDIVDLDVRKNIPQEVEQYKAVLNPHNIFSFNSISHGMMANYVAKNAKNNESVFCGEISDGIFNLGFSQFVTIFHPVIEFREYSDKMASYLFGPTFLEQLKSGNYKTDVIYNLMRGRYGKSKFDAPAKDKTLQLLSSFFLRGARFPFYSLENSNMITKKGVRTYKNEMESTYLKTAAHEITPDTLYSWYAHLYNSFHWQGSTVSTFGQTAESQNFHMSLPFWDSRIQDFCSSMPESFGRGLEIKPTKYPLKWILKNRIDYPMHLQLGPHAYQYDVNPSVTPIGELMNASAFSKFFRDKLKQRKYRDVLSGDVFNLNYLDKIASKYIKGQKIEGGEMADVLSLSLHSMMGLGE